MATYYTLVYKTCDCPLWKEKVTITAKYRFANPDNPYLANFVFASCEILENFKLPDRKKDRRLSLFRFCDLGSSCPCLHDFPFQIDFRA